jgi:hypothetical protein
MREGSSWSCLRQGMSSDIQRVARRLGPAGPRVLQRLSIAGRRGFARLRTAS